MGGGTLIFSYICRLGPFFGVQNLNFNILGVFRKMNIVGVYGNCEYIWGSLQNWTIWVIISIHSRAFS